jgi:hypothetical protein
LIKKSGQSCEAVASAAFNPSPAPEGKNFDKNLFISPLGPDAPVAEVRTELFINKPLLVAFPVDGKNRSESITYP